MPLVRSVMKSHSLEEDDHRSASQMDLVRERWEWRGALLVEHQPHKATDDWRGGIEALRTETAAGAWHRAVIACGGQWWAISEQPLLRPELDLELLAHADDMGDSTSPSFALSRCFSRRVGEPLVSYKNRVLPSKMSSRALQAFHGHGLPCQLARAFPPAIDGEALGNRPNACALRLEADRTNGAG